MNKWTFSEMEFDNWVHEPYNTKEEAINAGKRHFDDQVCCYVGRLVDMGKHEAVVDTEKVLIN